MKKQVVLFMMIVFLTGISSLDAQITVSGVFDSTLSMSAGAGEAADFSLGMEGFANIRLQSRLRDGKGRIEIAFNLMAATGDPVLEMAELNPSGYIFYDNFIAGIEIERLFFRLNGDYIDLDAGLFRLPFGYGQVWGSSDFINPRNPLILNARPRGIMGAALSWFPADDFKVLGFGASPRDLFSNEGKGWLAGLLLENHWEKLSVQGLYSYETETESSKYGIHRAGLSVKADVEIGLVIDALYTYNHEAETELDGLSFSVGADYSFIDGKLIVLLEYLYNGAASSTALGYGGSFQNEHYLYSGFTWLFNDFTNMSVALISGLSDISFTPVVTVTHEFFQGAALTVSAQVPMDRDLFSGDGNRGELGPIRPGAAKGSYFNLGTTLRLRF